MGKNGIEGWEELDLSYIIGGNVNGTATWDEKKILQFLIRLKIPAPVTLQSHFQIFTTNKWKHMIT